MTESSYLLSIDQGTSSSRAVLFARDGSIKSISQKELKLHYPQDGWVEQDARDILRDTLWAIENIFRENSDINHEIAAAGITNQRETVIVWDRKSGEPIYNAIVWQDRRTAEYCRQLREEGVSQIIAEKTGLLIDPYFSATKIKWILDHVSGARERANRGELLCGTVDCFLLWNLTGGKVHATDATNASRTMLYNIIGQRWDDDLLNIFKIPASMLPEVLDNVADYGTLKNPVSGHELAIGGMAGDQQAALIGQACLREGMTKSTYGTGCFALMNIGEKFVISKNRLLTTIAYRIKNETTYALEGSIFNAGTAIQFLRDNLNFFEKSAQSEEQARSVADTNGVYFVPAFTGLGAPHWNPDARGVICGLGRDSTKAHITRAAIEAQGFQTRDLIAAMQEDSASTIAVMRVDGGLVANNLMCQFLSDMLQRPVEIPKVIERTAWGAACLAGVQSGVFQSLAEVSSQWYADRTYVPEMPVEESDRRYAKWKEAVQKS